MIIYAISMTTQSYEVRKKSFRVLVSDKLLMVVMETANILSQGGLFYGCVFTRSYCFSGWYCHTPCVFYFVSPGWYYLGIFAVNGGVCGWIADSFCSLEAYGSR